MTDVTPAAAASFRPPRLAFGRWWLPIALAAVFAAFALARPEMAEAGNLATVLRSFSLMALMILGLTWVVAAGKIDVSFMQIAALANMTVATLVAGGAGWGVAAAAGLAVGLGVGLLNGVLVAVAGLSPLITTIATGGICGSIAAALGKGTSVRIDDPGPLGAFLAAGVGPIPAVAIAVVALYALAWWVQERLTFGHYVYAVEQNEEAVRETGIPVGAVVTMLYAASGVCAGLAGVLLVASLSSGQPMIGASYFIDGLTAVLLGAMMLRIGQPNVIGTATAALLLAVLVSGGAMLGWPDWQREIIKGAILLAGVVWAVRLRRRAAAAMSRGGRPS
ncbi:ABC transporter permease [Oharaeibacter diazotrophicus]|uniref:Ribose transport system permease protein n=1 Tax=Oharaeibacter diazotrophicus TaxID=1920512 RepID=A0A4R6RFJ4_9HYPH|nr:ABC transporter permease [Oharaeibacter diazotrophicus]TDP85030.1 ribose transport system permease protein [Oharaeibacter diazotrophicus]BBE74000.1 ribose transport system permease protein RbsC [Pleomorphomonas sp. SM30]GLS76312.1 ribose ABC transporter permease [Oharaeibacter diazotrophicus]